jgi:hypothetical protein
MSSHFYIIGLGGEVLIFCFIFNVKGLSSSKLASTNYFVMFTFFFSFFLFFFFIQFKDSTTKDAVVDPFLAVKVRCNSLLPQSFMHFVLLEQNESKRRKCF